MNKTAVPFFSIIVPIYNNEKDIEKCILSILAQTYKEYEVILVDDRSTDKSSRICDYFAYVDERIQVIHRKKNGGAAAARNEGLSYAKGKFVCFVDGDDWIAEELLEKAYRKLDGESSLDMFVFCYIKVQKDGRYDKRQLQIADGIYEKGRLIKEIYPSMICKVGRAIQSGIDSGSLCDKIIRRELLIKHYCKDTTLFRGEDSVCAWECMYYARSIYFSEAGMYFYNCMEHNFNKRKYHPDLYENNKAVAAYLRLHLCAEKDFQIERQINALEFRGMVDVIRQEIDCFHFIWNAAGFLHKKCRNVTNICSGNGLPLNARLYILLINRRCFMLLLAGVFMRYCINALFRTLQNLFQLRSNNYRF